MDGTYTTVIVGAGPAGIGLLVAAAQSGVLAGMLDAGVAVVERGSRSGVGSLDRYDLNSDSLATSFVECAEHPAAGDVLDELRSFPTYSRLAGRRLQHVPLTDVAGFLGDVGQIVRRALERHPRCDFLPETTVRSLRLMPGGRVAVELQPDADEEQPRLLHAKSVVLALGGRQDLDHVLGQQAGGARLADHADRLMLTDGIVSRGGEQRLAAALARPPRRVVIIGGSHSAFSVAWILAERLPADWFGEADVVVCHRDRVRIFYPTPEDAREEGYLDFDASDICPRTGRVHRLGGLRGDGRTLWRRITGRAQPAESRVTLRRLTDDPASMREFRDLIAAATVIVPAFGYRSRTLTVSDARGRRLRLHAEDGGPLVDRDARVLLADGEPLTNVFGIGMASGFRPPGEAGFSGQTNGVWLYHNPFGRRVLDGIASATA